MRKCRCERSGIPQGSNLGPLLFVLHINDVSTILPGDNNLLYADDTKIFRQIQGQDDHRLQASLDDFYNWCTRNSLTIWVDKCVTINIIRSRSPEHFDYTLNGQTLPRVDCVKDLGVLVDAKLTFEQHLDHVVKRWSHLLGLVVNPICTKTLYCTLIRSVLEYGSVVWWPSSAREVARLESIQRRANRFAILSWGSNNDYTTRCFLLDLPQLDDRIRNARLAFIVGLLNDSIDCPAARTLRPRAMLVIPETRTAFASRDPFLRICLALIAASVAYEPGMTIANVLSRINFLRASHLNL